MLKCPLPSLSAWLRLGLVFLGAIPGFSGPVISEFLAANGSGLKDEDGEFSDWIEIYNPDSTPVSVEGYYLTDSATNLRKWAFPQVTLNPGAYLVVFASEKDRVVPEGRLHTNFKLSPSGEFLA